MKGLLEGKLKKDGKKTQITKEMRLFANTQYLSEAAIHFKKHGRYTLAPKGHKDWVEYWTEQDRRCREGYSVGDIKITGKHYFMLNFQPMMVYDKNTKSVVKGIEAKKLLFPRFWKVHYDWWWAKEIAMKGATADFVRDIRIDALPIQDYVDGKNMICLKTRRAGFSYLEANDGVWNYNFLPGSKSYFFAAILEYLTVDGILNKVEAQLNFLNKHTDGYWRKNRQKKSTTMHNRASYIDGKGNEKGYLSEIMGVIVNDPNKVRGKDGVKITYEEAGSFPRLQAALAISMPSAKAGAQFTGQHSVFGTGGEEGPGIQGLEDIFQNPHAYDMLAFRNVWEEGYEATECGYFVPCTAANETFMDMDGNIDLQANLEFEERERRKAMQSKDPKKLDRHKAEYPFVPSEALMRITGNIFPTEQIMHQIKYVKGNKALQSFIRYGDLISDQEKGIIFQLNPKAVPLLKYPHNQAEDDLTGTVTIFEQPWTDLKGKIPENLYKVVVDPYVLDEAEDLTSLFACYVVKRTNMLTETQGDIIVASYIGRPKSLEANVYPNLFNLCRYYNATIQAEIAGGGQGIVTYGKNKGLLHLLCYEPEIVLPKERQGRSNRSVFMKMTSELKRQGLTYLVEWLLKVRGYDDQGNEILNLHKIYDLGLLIELSKWNPTGNFDRISAMILAMYELRDQEIQAENDFQEQLKDDFFSRALYGTRAKSNLLIFRDPEYKMAS